ncbi:hypothetical protein [Thermococcus sp.]
MGKYAGAALAVIGIILWYYGGTSGSAQVVNLGIGTIILAIVFASFPLGGYVSRNALSMSVHSPCVFIVKAVRDLGLSEKPIVIPPYDNLSQGGLFFPGKDGSVPNLGLLDGESVFVANGLLISPPPGRDVVEYAIENSGELSGAGVGYASSAISSALSALGIGSGEAFESEDGRIEVFVRPLCGESPQADPAVSAMLLGIAIGKGEVLRVESLEMSRGHVKAVVEPLGGVERWL